MSFEAKTAQAMGLQRREVLDEVVFILPRGEVTLSLERGSFGSSGDIWVARAKDGLRHGSNPVTVLNRFVSLQRAERMVGAMLALR